MSFFHMVRVFVFFTIRINKIAMRKLYLKGLVNVQDLMVFEYA
jgi:hypothetical protein